MSKEKNRGYCSNKVVVRDTGLKGSGLFSIDKIKKGETILIWQGWVMSKSDLLKEKKRYLRDAIQIGEDFFVGCKSDKDLEKSDYINHSCDPNAGFCGDLTIVAMRDIDKGEEITFDYAMCDNLNELKMNCKCGSNVCRGIISGRDWKILSLQKKYKGYFSSYIARKIKSEK